MADVGMEAYIDQTARKKAAFSQAVSTFPDDKLAATVLAHQLFNDPNKHIHQEVYWDRSTVVTEFSDPVFGSVDRQILSKLQERYGANLRVEVAVADDRRYFRVWVFHQDFLNRIHVTKDRLEHCMFEPSLAAFAVYELGSFYSLYSRLGQYSAVRDILEDVLPPVRKEGDVCHLPVVEATPSEVPVHSFAELPKFGAPVTGVDPDLLLGDGVVIDCGKIGRYRVWFDWETAIDSDNTPTCKVVPTDDPATEGSDRYTGLQLRGHGRSDNWIGIVPLRLATKCLFVMALPYEKYLLCVHAIVKDGQIRAVCTNR